MKWDYSIKTQQQIFYQNNFWNVFKGAKTAKKKHCIVVYIH